MKNLILVLIVAIGSSVSASDNIILFHSNFHCESSSEELQGTVSLNHEDGLYTISHWGHIRNSYSAEYISSYFSTTRYGNVSDLAKSRDLSTWKDMPDVLELKYFSTLKTWELSGLKEDSVSFHVSDCESK